MALWNWLRWAFTKVGEAPAKLFSGFLKDITGSAKDVVSTRRDIVETKIAQKKLEESERLIQPATLSDVKRYDPKVKHLESVVNVFLWAILLALMTFLFAPGISVDIQKVFKEMPKGLEK